MLVQGPTQEDVPGIFLLSTFLLIFLKQLNIFSIFESSPGNRILENQNDDPQDWLNGSGHVTTPPYHWSCKIFISAKFCEIKSP